MGTKPIYLDHQSTTPLDPRVLEAMLPYFTEHFGNPSSNSHIYGWEAQAAVKKARETIAETINATPEEIIFTSSATEANNLAIKGVAESYYSKGRHIITLQTEHKAVLDPCKYLESLGFEVTYLPVQKNGLVDLELLEKSIRPETILVSVMMANNEIGVLQPLEEIGQICKKYEVILHSDAAQALTKIPIDLQKLKIDIMSITAHKMYGPKGIGALYVRRRDPRVRLAAQIQGGGQERGLRSGTLYTPQIVGFAKACEIGLALLSTESKRQTELRERLWQKISQLPGIHLNGDQTRRLPGNLNISVEDVDGSALLLGLVPIVALSSGSACTSTSISPSHVLTALGHSPTLAYASIRFGIGRSTTTAEIDVVSEHVKKTIISLRVKLTN